MQYKETHPSLDYLLGLRDQWNILSILEDQLVEAEIGDVIEFPESKTFEILEVECKRGFYAEEGEGAFTAIIKGDTPTDVYRVSIEVNSWDDSIVNEWFVPVVEKEVTVKVWELV